MVFFAPDSELVPVVIAAGVTVRIRGGAFAVNQQHTLAAVKNIIAMYSSFEPQMIAAFAAVLV